MASTSVLQGYAQGGEGYLGIKLVWRPGDVGDRYAFSTPDEFLIAENIGFAQDYIHIEHDAYVGSRDTDKGHRHGKGAAGGPITFALYPTNGNEVWEAGLGFQGSLDALTPDTTTDIVTGASAAPDAPVTTPFSVAAPLTAPTTTPSGTGGTLAAGTYKYAVTFTTADGETGIGPETAGDVLSGSTSSDALSDVPLGDLGTTSRKIYRKFNTGTYHLVHTLADNTTTIWTDDGSAVAGAAPPVEGTLAADTYEYAVTFVTGFGETDLGTATAGDVLTGAGSSDALSVIPLGPVGTTARNIYRKIGAADFFQVHVLADNTSTTWTDFGAADGAVAPVANTTLPSGTTLLVLAAGNAGYSASSDGGRIVLVGSGLKQELRSVLSYNASKKWLYVAKVGERDGIEITHATSGTVVYSPAQKLERPIIKTDFSRNYTNLLPFIAAEENVGGKYAYRYRGGQVGKLDLKATAAKTTVTAEIMFSKPRVLANGEGGNPDPTEFDDTQASLNDLSLEYQDGFVMMDADPDSTQVPMLQRFDDIVEFELNFNNNLKEEGPMDGTSVKRFLPGAKRKLDVKWKNLNYADYPVVWEKFLSKDKDATFMALFAINEGTDASPTWKARSFYLPHVRYVKSTEVRGLTDTVGEQVEGVARRASGAEKIYVYSIV